MDKFYAKITPVDGEPYFALVEPVGGNSGDGYPAHPIHRPDLKPEHPIVLPPLPPDMPNVPGYPAHPIVLPGVPTHPIYYPVSPEHPIVLPPGDVWPCLPCQTGISGDVLLLIDIPGVGYRWLHMEAKDTYSAKKSKTE